MPDFGQARVRLDPLSESDVDDILTWVNAPEVVGNIATFSGTAFTRDDELRYIASTRASKSDRVFSARDPTDDGYIGQVGIHQIHWRSRVGRLALVIAEREKMGQGFGTATAAACIDYAFDELELHKLWLMIFETNTRSEQIYARLGFIEEGLLREEYFHNDGWHNMRRMSLLQSEWAKPAS